MNEVMKVDGNVEFAGVLNVARDLVVGDDFINLGVGNINRDIYLGGAMAKCLFQHSIGTDTPFQTITDCHRLLMNFLEHVMSEITTLNSISA